MQHSNEPNKYLPDEESICDYGPIELVTGENLLSLAIQMKNEVEIKDRSKYLRTYSKCFLGKDAIRWLMGTDMTMERAEFIGTEMIKCGYLRHVTGGHQSLKNEELFYVFSDEVTPISDNIESSVMVEDISEALGGDSRQTSGDLQTNLDILRSLNSFKASEGAEVAPLDEHNQKLLANVHPSDWENPDPSGIYNLVVIGAGTGGLVSAAGSASLSAKVAMIEANLLGGDCLNVGCVPSKALIKCAEVVQQVRKAEMFGVSINGPVQVDFPKIMERMRKLRAGISHHDSVARFSGDLGVDVFLGWAQFHSPNAVTVNGKTIRFKKAVIASGAKATVPSIEGIENVPYLTNTSFFNLTEMPSSMLVIGAGPIGLELAQCMARFGCQVTVVLRGEKILPKEDPDAARVIYQSLQEDGITFIFNAIFLEITHQEAKGGQAFGETALRIEKDGATEVVKAHSLLLGTGRMPNVQNMGLEKAGVQFNKREGILVNDFLQTSAKNIYAVGDCCTKFQFTHVADFMARIVIRNALFFGRSRFSSLLIPWSTFTFPEVAHVGLYPRDLEEKGIKYTTFTKQFSEVDRAILDGTTEGFVKIHCKKGSDEILGATIVGPHAGDMISEVSVAIQHGIGLGSLASVIHPYPTKAEAIRQAGDLYNKTKLTPKVKKLLRKTLKLQRKI